MISSALWLEIGSRNGDHVQVRVDIEQSIAGRVHLGPAHILGAVEQLALQVGDIDRVEIDDADGAHAGCGQVHGRRAAEAARADQQHLAVEQLELAHFADLVEQRVAAVANALFVVEHGGNLEIEAGVLPAVEAADQRDGFVVAHLQQIARGQHRAHAAGAVDHQRLVPIRLHLLDLEFQEATRHKDRAGQMTLDKLVPLAHVDDGQIFAGVQPLLQLLHRDLIDLVLCHAK